MTVIDIGDGRFVEFTEGALLVPPPPPPKPKKPWVPPKKRNGNDKSVVIRGFKFKCDPRPADRKNRGNPNLQASKSQALLDWAARRAGQLLALTAQGRALGTPAGMTKKKADALWAVARRKAKIDMANIKKSMDLPAAAEEALTSALEVMRSPMTQTMKLSAAKLVLDFTMAKPAAKSDVTIASAELWLAGLANE